jgi:hypothetical protein
MYAQIKQNIVCKYNSNVLLDYKGKMLKKKIHMTVVYRDTISFFK